MKNFQVFYYHNGESTSRIIAAENHHAAEDEVRRSVPECEVMALLEWTLPVDILGN